nr:hyp [Cotesia vestalis bracovirus]
MVIRHTTPDTESYLLLIPKIARLSSAETQIDVYSRWTMLIGRFDPTKPNNEIRAHKIKNKLGNSKVTSHQRTPYWTIISV